MLVYILGMVVVVRCLLTSLSFGSQLKLATVFGVAAADLGTDLAYVITQPYANLNLFMGSCAFVILPSLVYLYASGASGRFLRSMLPFYADVWFALYCMRRWAVDAVKNLLHNAGAIVCTHLIAASFLVFLFFVVFPCVVGLLLVVSLIAPLFMISVYLVSINLKLPIFGQLWARINKYMTLDVVRITPLIGAPPAPSPPVFAFHAMREHYMEQMSGGELFMGVLFVYFGFFVDGEEEKSAKGD